MSIKFQPDLVFLTMPAAGNEPFLLAVAVAKKINEILKKKGVQPGKIVVPATAPNVKTILENEHRDDLGDVFLDLAYGQIVQKTLATQGNFRAHMEHVLGSHKQVDREIQQRFNKNAGSFDTYSFASAKNNVPLDTANVVTLDIAARFCLKDASSSHFIFPTLISELMEATREAKLGFDESDIVNFSKIMFELEKCYTNVFISKLGTLSGTHLSIVPDSSSIEQRYRTLSTQQATVNGRTRIYTPGMGRGDLVDTSVLGADSVYAMFSGTGSAISETRTLAGAMVDEGQSVLVPEWVRDIPGSKSMTPSMIFDPRVKGVLARSGWGTLWKTMRAGKPFIAIPYRDGDDPEIFFNDKTVKRMGLGGVLKPDMMSPAAVQNLIRSTAPNLAEINRLTVEEFGTTDGVTYVAEIIAADVLKKLLI